MIDRTLEGYERVPGGAMVRFIFSVVVFMRDSLFEGARGGLHAILRVKSGKLILASGFFKMLSANAELSSRFLLTGFGTICFMRDMW